MRNPHGYIRQVQSTLIVEYARTLDSPVKTAAFEEYFGYARFLMEDGAFLMASDHLKAKAKDASAGSKELQKKLLKISEHIRGHAMWCTRLVMSREEMRKVDPRVCGVEEDHKWRTEPNSYGLIDVCIDCGETRA